MSSIPTGSVWRHHLIGCGILCDSGDATQRRIADELGLEHVIHGGQRVSVVAGKMTVAFSANPPSFEALFGQAGKKHRPPAVAAACRSWSGPDNAFYAGRLHPRTAAGLAPLMHLKVCAIEMTSLEQRIPKVERLLAKAETEKSADRGWKTPTA